MIHLFLYSVDTVFFARNIALRGCIRKSLLTFRLVAMGFMCKLYSHFFFISVLISTHKLHLNASFAS